MATKTQTKNVTQQKKVYVKSETAFQQMQTNGQLEANAEYYTPDDTDAVFMPVGAIFSSAIPQTDARVHILDGSTISQSGMYAEFATLLKTLVSSGYKVSCTYSEYQSDIDNYGQCGKFVIDNNAGTIRLPKITKFVEGLTSLSNIGKSFSAGLPNIKGQFQKDTILVGSPDLATGPFSLYHNQNWNVAGGGGTNPIHHVTFDANKANSIYKDDVTTVQPQSTAYPYYIVLAGGYKSPQTVNIDNVASDLALVKTRYVVETWINGYNWYTKYNDGWKECGLIKSNNTQGTIGIALPVSFTTNQYTVITQIAGGTFESGGNPNGTNLSQFAGLVYQRNLDSIYIQSFGRDYYVYACGY